jgi:hypothetical protein
MSKGKDRSVGMASTCAREESCLEVATSCSISLLRRGAAELRWRNALRQHVFEADRVSGWPGRGSRRAGFCRSGNQRAGAAGEGRLTSTVIGWWTNKYGIIGNHCERWGINPLVAGSSPARPT